MKITYILNLILLMIVLIMSIIMIKNKKEKWKRDWLFQLTLENELTSIKVTLKESPNINVLKSKFEDQYERCENLKMLTSNEYEDQILDNLLFIIKSWKSSKIISNKDLLIIKQITELSFEAIMLNRKVLLKKNNIV